MDDESIYYLSIANNLKYIYQNDVDLLISTWSHINLSDVVEWTSSHKMSLNHIQRTWSHKVNVITRIIKKIKGEIKSKPGDGVDYGGGGCQLLKRM